jgi:mannose/fructose/N-acetylgalactosamine-specific phosphotransferase system component IID
VCFVGEFCCCGGGKLLTVKFVGTLNYQQVQTFDVKIMFTIVALMLIGLVYSLCLRKWKESVTISLIFKMSLIISFNHIK